MKRMLAIDFGASGGKCFVGTLDGADFAMKEVHRFAHEPVSFHVPDAAGQAQERTYWDDVLLYHNIVAGLGAARRETGGQLDALGIDAWGADGAFLTAEGDMLGNLYCYRDHRLDTMIDEVKARLDPKRIYEITGIHFQPFNVSNQLLWFATRRADLLRKAAVYLPVPALFSHYLGGRPCIDSAWASITQVMDAKRRRWSPVLLKALGIPRKLMPEIVAPGTVTGYLREGLAASAGLNRAAIVAVGSHDTACAFASAPVDDTRTALIISSGTWSLVGKLLAKPITTDAAMAANLSNEGGIGNVRFLKNCMGSWLVQELRRGWRNADGREMGWAELDALTLQAPPLAALIDPDDSSFYNPPSMEQAILAFCARTGQPAPAGRGGLMRTVYESLALKYRLVSEQIAAVSGSATKVVHIVGGGCRNTMLNQFTADALGLPVLAGPEEATAVGNLMVQAMGLGVIATLKDAQPLIRKAFGIARFEPRDPGAWTGAYARFRSLCGT